MENEKQSYTYDLDEFTKSNAKSNAKNNAELFVECGGENRLGLTCRHEVLLVNVLIQDLKTELSRTNVEFWQLGGTPMYDTFDREVVWVDPNDNFEYWCLDSAVLMMNQFRGKNYNLCRLRKCLQDACFLYAIDSVPGIEPRFRYPFYSWEKGNPLGSVKIEVDDDVIDWMSRFNTSVQEHMNKFSDKSVIVYNQIGNISPSVEALAFIYFPYYYMLPSAERICATYWATLMWGMMECILKQPSYKKILTHRCR